MEKESSGDRIQAANARWSFGGEVPGQFEEHINRSVPSYRDGHEIVAAISDFFLKDGSTVYELGCSTGALLRRLADWNDGKDVSFVGFDVEPSMVREATEKCQSYNNIKIIQDDVLDAEFEHPADLVVAYYTVQFISPARRQEIFDRVYDLLNWGGGFVLFEKVRAPDARFQDMMTALYTDYKLGQGYEPSEIVNKSRSLKGVLEPFSTRANLDLMQRAGFEDVMSVFKHLCFEGFLAIK